MSASFQVPNDDPVEQVEQMADVEDPDGLPEAPLFRLFSMDYRMPTQPFDRALWPTRFWARSSLAIPDDPLTQACVLTYLSDLSSGVLPSPDGSIRPSSSLDHAVWFHAPVDVNEWLLSDYQPRVTGHGRGWYTGSIFDTRGGLVASLTQETLFR